MIRSEKGGNGKLATQLISFVSHLQHARSYDASISSLYYITRKFRQSYIPPLDVVWSFRLVFFLCPPD